MLNNGIFQKDYGAGTNILFEIYGVDSIAKFKKMSNIYLGNIAVHKNHDGFTNGPFDVQFMHPDEERMSYEAIESQRTDYKIDDIIYHVNEYGFRGTWDLERDDTSNSIATFGCSFTFGVGCDLENLWTEILAKNLNKKLFNFGVGATGIEHSAMIYSLLSRFVRFDQVVVLVPHFYRVLFPHSRTKHSFNFYNFLHDFEAFSTSSEVVRNKVYDIFDETYLKHRMFNSINSMINCAKMNGTKIYFSSWEHETYDCINKAFGHTTNILPFHILVDGYYGRDGGHSGKVANRKMADKYTEVLKLDGV